MKKNVYVKKAKEKLTKVQDFLADPKVSFEKDRFIEKFILCEIAYKTLLIEYKKSKNEQVDQKNLKLHMKTIPLVLKFAGIDIGEHVLKSIFSSQGNRNNKSAKQLRDAIVHNLSIPDINEVYLRRNKLNSYLDEFLSAFSFKTISFQTKNHQNLAS